MPLSYNKGFTCYDRNGLLLLWICSVILHMCIWAQHHFNIIHNKGKIVVATSYTHYPSKVYSLNIYNICSPQDDIQHSILIVHCMTKITTLDGRMLTQFIWHYNIWKVYTYLETLIVVGISKIMPFHLKQINQQVLYH